MELDVVWEDEVIFFWFFNFELKWEVRLLVKNEEERKLLEIGGKRKECGCESVSLENRRISWLGKCSRFVKVLWI